MSSNSGTPRWIVWLYAAPAVTALVGVSYRMSLRTSFLGVLDLLGYFTIQSNLLVLALAAWSVVSILRGRDAPPAGLRLAAGVYIAVTMIVYNTLLLPTTTFGSTLDFMIGQVNHTITPILWLLCVLLPRDVRRVEWLAPVRWLVYPTVYAVFATIEGTITGRYRYFFVNLGSLGLARYLGWVAAVTILFVALGFGLRAAFLVRNRRLAVA